MAHNHQCLLWLLVLPYPGPCDRRCLDVRPGRFGGILGAFSGAFLMQAQLSFETIFTFLAIPALVSALALMVKYWVGKRQLPLTQSATEDLSSATQKPDYIAWRELFRQAIKICASLHWL